MKDKTEGEEQGQKGETRKRKKIKAETREESETIAVESATLLSDEKRRTLTQ